jgi:dipeptidyl aminopeptidase/acylaminoacyl peptidase
MHPTHVLRTSSIRHVPRPIVGLAVASALAMAFAVSAQEASIRVETPHGSVKAAPIEAYAAIPGARGARLSPNGRYLAYIGALDGHTALVIQDLQGHELPKAIPTGEGELNWILWKSDQRLVISVRAVSARMALRRSVETRLIGLDRDGSHVVELVQAESSDNQPQIQDRVVSELPEDPDHLLIQLPKIDRTARTPPSQATLLDRSLHPEVVRVDVHTGMTQTVAAQHGLISDWIATRAGAVNLGWAVKRDGSLTLLARDTAQSPWKAVQTLPLNQGEVFEPLAFVEGEPGRVFVESNHDGGHTGLYEFDLGSSRYVRTLKVDPRIDVTPIVEAGHLLGYEDDDSGTVYLDADWAADARLIDKALPGSTHRIVDRSRDGRHVLLSVVKGNEPRDYWLLTRDAGKADLEPVTDAYPALVPEQIAPSRWVSYEARDGLNIPAILTLPTGYRPGPHTAPVPFVLLPHGGPSAHDERGFDYWVQFLASRGYGVLQPQFRGSTGYGRDFLTAGYQQWGLAMQDDVTDGTRWLIRQGLADPERIAIVGASYGGYAALMGVAKEPTLYRCAAAFAPVTDLLTLVEDQRSYVFGDLNLPQIGPYGATLEQTSPVHLVDRITRPVLLVHGRKDYTVPVQHTEEMDRAMTKAGKPVQTVYLDDADHYFTRTADRLRLLQALQAFLDANMK